MIFNKKIDFYTGITFFIISSFSLYAQDQKPCFTLTYSKGCIPFNTRAITCFGVDNATYSFDGGITFSANISFTFTVANLQSNENRKTFPIIQSVPGSGGSLKDTLYIEVFRPKTPVFDYAYCSGNKIKFNLLDTLYDNIFINFGNGQTNSYNSKSNFEYEYASSATNVITIKGYFDNGQPISEQINCSDTTFTLSIINTLKKASIDSLIVQDENKIKLTFQLQAHYTYFLEEKIGTDNFRRIQNIDNTKKSLILSKKELSSNIYCYRVNTYDSCHINPNNYLNELCSYQFNVSAENGLNVLNWSDFSNGLFASYNIYKNSQLVKTFTHPDSVSWKDTDIKCLVDDCYYLEVRTKIQDDLRVFTSFSRSVCVTGNTVEMPIAVSAIYASVEGNNIIVRWNKPNDTQIGKFLVFKSENGGAFTKTQITEDSLTDSNAHIFENQYCYKVQLLDKCGNSSAKSKTTCPVLLKNRKQAQDHLLEWSAYKGFSNDEYTLEQLDQEDNVLKNIAVLASNELSFIHLATAFDRDQMIYRIKTSSLDNAAFVSYSNKVIVTTKPDIEVPDAFTPNNDGLNDTFDVIVQLLKSFEIKIYNRWGNPIFESDNINKSWDGKVNGEEAIEGTYTYVIKGIDELNRVFLNKGVLLLIR